MAVITVSKETGCGEEVCEAVADILKYRIINKDMVRYAAALSSMEISDAERFDEQNYSSLRRILGNYIDLSLFSTEDLIAAEDFMAKRYSYMPYDYAATPTGENFQSAVEKVVRILASEGKAVIVGRGGNFVLHDHPHTLHVRLIAPLGMRTENIMSVMELDRTQAEKYAVETDRKKSAYIRHYYNAKIDDPANYHITMNLGRFSVPKASALIASAAEEFDQKRP